MSIVFNKEKHTYTDTERQIEFISGTQLKSAFVPEFQKMKISGFVANKQNRTQEDVLCEWGLKRDIACNLGDYIHQSVEAWIKHDVAKEKNPITVLTIDKFPLKKDNLVSEHMTYNKECALAGTIDLVKETDEDMVLYDIKTNTDLKKKRGYLLEPFDDISNNKINKYRMQLTIYKMMEEERAGKDISGIKLLHWKPIMKDGLIDIEWEVIDLEPIKQMEEMGLKELVKISGLEPIKVDSEEEFINQIV